MRIATAAAAEFQTNANRAALLGDRRNMPRVAIWKSTAAAQKAAICHREWTDTKIIRLTAPAIANARQLKSRIVVERCTKPRLMLFVPQDEPLHRASRVGYEMCEARRTDWGNSLVAASLT